MASELTSPLLYALWNSVIILVHGVIYISTIVLAYRFLKMGLRSDAPSSAMAGIKLPFYDFFGIFRFFPSYSTMEKMSLPSPVYLLQILGGLITIFNKEKIIKTTIAFKDAYILSKPESVEELLCNKVETAKPFTDLLNTFYGTGLFTSFGVRWKTEKKYLKPVFHYNVVKKYIPNVDKNSKIFVEMLRQKQHEEWIDIVLPTKLCAMKILCETFLGIDMQIEEGILSQLVKRTARALQIVLKRMSDPMLHFDVIFRFTALNKQFKEDMDYLRTFFGQVIEQKKEALELLEKENGMPIDPTITSGSNFIYRIINFHKETPGYTEKDTSDELLSFVSAGVDTAAAGLTWTLYFIGLYPKVQQKIQEELDFIFGDDHERAITEEDLKKMSYIECVIKEAQRLYPAGPVNARYALENLNLCGYEIKKGSIMIADFYHLHRNPDVFPNPEVFDPDRFLPENSVNYHPFAYVPFSAGTRACIGRRFAMIEMKTVVANALRNFSLQSMESRDKINMSFEIALHSPNPVKIKVTPRKISQT